EYQILVVEKRPYMGTQIPMMKIYHCQVKQSTPQCKIFWRVIHRVRGILGGVKNAIALMNWLSIQEYEMLMEYSEGGLKNAIAFMNGVVDPNIKYWWLKKDLICGHRFP
ncbi:hypothetical protein CEP13_17165, partial [Cylindrospermopsis raciborskii C03]